MDGGKDEEGKGWLTCFVNILRKQCYICMLRSVSLATSFCPRVFYVFILLRLSLPPSAYRSFSFSFLPFFFAPSHSSSSSRVFLLTFFLRIPHYHSLFFLLVTLHEHRHCLVNFNIISSFPLLKQLPFFLQDFTQHR